MAGLHFAWILIFAQLTPSLKSDEILTLEIPPYAMYANVAYGGDRQQVLDVYLPGGRDASVSKVIVLIHGGGWSGGNKESMNVFVGAFRAGFPRYVIVNMGYRLGTTSSPGYPKQIEDIKLALSFITSNAAGFQFKPEFGLVGVSAGAHLSMLYGYSIDNSRQVNVICNIVGPTDLTDPAYTTNPMFNDALKVLVGNTTYEENPEIYATVSPVTHITKLAPKTISFYGGRDELIPNSQGTTLEAKLDAAGVYNKYHFYPEEGHMFADPKTIEHFVSKTFLFFKNYL